MASPERAAEEEPAPAEIRVVVAVIGGRRYAFPLESVERILRMVDITPLPDAPPLVLGVVDVAGAVLPVLDLRRRLGHGRSPCRLDDRLLMLRREARRVLVPAEDVVGVLPATPAQLAPPPEPAGEEVPVEALLESDGELAVILDPAGIFPPEHWKAPEVGESATGIVGGG